VVARRQRQVAAQVLLEATPVGQAGEIVLAGEAMYVA